MMRYRNYMSRLEPNMKNLLGTLAIIATAVFVSYFLVQSAKAAEYSWQSNPFLNGSYKTTYEPYYRKITKPNPYNKKELRTEDNYNNVWITKPNPYNKNEMITTKLH